MMNIFSKLNQTHLLIPLLLSTIQPCFAANVGDTAELKVTGKITPSSCTLTLGTGSSLAGVLNYDNVRTSVSSATPTFPYAALGTLTLPNAVTVNCEGATLIGVTTTDNRSATISAAVPDAKTYTNTGAESGYTTHLLGLGLDSNNATLGAYAGTFINLKVDGIPARFSTCMDETVFTGANIEQGGALVVGACPAGQSHQVLDTNNASLTGNTFVWDYIIDSYTQKLSTLDPNGWHLDGSVTVQINYL
ncbi:DUF1120 domain-containing protein [Obesumbacterium proteus]|uniref:DUF1120 domain-containing protein n=1 Tax=Obesumbacterium proteus ATCC 12841 TaxID=1354268 RepID=A0AA91EBN2_9GAMM|nr:DUF1120 domain-containing protein [Obesumbacterium proteus]AMO82583.1 hypothetical protein DSM2777_17005 [Obesumbacterium proteus]OAT57661.1 hypothetical protein M993_03405 [Obesumbacterium proteus ATCC 12841]